MSRKLSIALLALVALGMPACRSEAPVLQQAQPAAPLLTGQIDTADRVVAATIGNIANGATVSLIDATTGQTVCTTISSATGAFSLYAAGAFVPVASRPYFLEAAKGLPVGGEANRAGASVARLRTILFYQGGSWVSLASAVPGSSVAIGPATTALAAIASLRSLTATDLNSLIGRLSGQVYAPVNGLIDATEFSAVSALVAAALQADQDPLEVISYDPNGASAATRYGKAEGPVVINDGLSPAIATKGGNVAVTGQNFPSGPDVTVSVGNLPVAGWAVNSDRTQLSISLSATAYGGILTITKATNTWTGPYVPVSGTVGTISGSSNVGGFDGQGGSAQWKQPIGLVAASGNLAIIDAAACTLRMLTPVGRVSTLAGTGNTGTADGPPGVGSMWSPHDVAKDAAGNFYVMEYGGNKVRKITPSGVLSTYAGTGVAGSANGATSSATFNLGTGVAVDANGNVYVGDGANQLIRKISTGGVVSTYAGVVGSAGSANGAATTVATFNNPRGMVFDTAGNLYVADESNNLIRKVDSAGTTVSNFSTTNTAAGPFDLAIDGSGILYVACRSANVIQKVATNGTVTTIAGSGTLGFKDGDALSAQFNSPSAVEVIGSNLYISDRLNGRIRVLTF